MPEPEPPTYANPMHPTSTSHAGIQAWNEAAPELDRSPPNKSAWHLIEYLLTVVPLPRAAQLPEDGAGSLVEVVDDALELAALEIEAAAEVKAVSTPLLAAAPAEEPLFR